MLNFENSIEFMVNNIPVNLGKLQISFYVYTVYSGKYSKNWIVQCMNGMGDCIYCCVMFYSLHCQTLCHHMQTNKKIEFYTLVLVSNSCAIGIKCRVEALFT